MQSKTNSINKTTKYYALPAFNKSPRKNSSLATNLATAGLFSALAACGGSSSSGSSSGNGNENVVKTTAIDFDTFTQAAAYVDGIRHVASDADSSTFYIREGLTSDDVLGTLPVTIDGEEAITYSIIGDAGSYFSFDQSRGELRLRASTPLVFNNSNSAAIDDSKIVITIQVTSGAESDSHSVTIQLGEDYRANNDGGAFYASVGDDLLMGGTGNDVLFGGAGNDILISGGGDDSLDGGAGDDSLTGNDDGVDQFWFEKSGSADTTNHDTIENFQPQKDMIIIKTGETKTSSNDPDWTVANLKFTDDGTADTKITVSAWGDNDSLTVNGQYADANEVAEWSKDIWFHQKGSGNVYGGSAKDFLEGSSGNDLIAGRVGNDIIYGYGGFDSIQGNPGNDIMYGGAGNDNIRGGPGNDIMYGGADKDEFQFYGSTAGNDTIKDFSRTDGDQVLIEFAGTSKFGDLTTTYSNGNAMVINYGAEGGTITFTAHDGIEWDETTNPLEATDFILHAGSATSLAPADIA